MNKLYHIIEQSYNDCAEITSESPLGFAPDSSFVSLLAGIPIPVAAPKIFEFEIDCEEGETPKHFIRGHGTLVISDALLNALRMAGVDNFESWPAILRDPSTNRTWEKYHAFNEIGLLDAALLKDCEYDVIMGGNERIPPLFGFKKVVFSAEKVMDAKMFRIPQSPRDLYISHEVMTDLNKLAPPEGWDLQTTDIEVK
jgi:hypothetical protein